MKLKIDAEFRDLCPPLSTEERQQLHDNIVSEGVVLDTIKVWDDIIIDGHNRYEIAEEQGVLYETVEMGFIDRNEALDWIIHNQLGRRNLDPNDAAYLRGKLYNGRKHARGGKRENEAENVYSRENNPKAQSEPLTSTADEVAAETGVSRETVKRDGKFAEAVDQLAPKARQAIQRKDVKASRSDVQKLAELPEDKQADVVETVLMGDAATVSDAIQADADPEEAQRRQIANNRKLAKDLIARAVRAVDDLHRVAPNQTKRAKMIRLIQDAGRELW